MQDLEEVGHVTIVHRQQYPLSRKLDRAGGEIVLRRIQGEGVGVRGVRTEKARPGWWRVALWDGRWREEGVSCGGGFGSASALRHGREKAERKNEEKE